MLEGTRAKTKDGTPRGTNAVAQTSTPLPSHPRPEKSGLNHPDGHGRVAESRGGPPARSNRR